MENNINNEVVKITTEAALMKKTKAELVQTIIKLDDRVTSLIKDIDDIITERSNIEQKLESVEEAYRKLEHDYQEECDDNVLFTASYKKDIKTWKLVSVLLFIMFILACVF